MNSLPPFVTFHLANLTYFLKPTFIDLSGKYIIQVELTDSFGKKSKPYFFNITISDYILPPTNNNSIFYVNFTVQISRASMLMLQLNGKYCEQMVNKLFNNDSLEITFEGKNGFSNYTVVERDSRLCQIQIEVKFANINEISKGTVRYF